jgi:predicted regulator of Ras-like GTPase activity (Roadblock/LC7/MglB family)
MLKEKISEFIDIVHAIEGVAACALVSRDDIGREKYFDRDLNSRLGAFLATILLSVESIGGIIRMKSQESIAIRAQDTSVMVEGAGENFLIAAITNNRTDPVNVQSQILTDANTIRESM